MKAATYLPPGDLDLAGALTSDLPCARCTRPPSLHAFDLLCPTDDERSGAPPVVPPGGRPADPESRGEPT